MGQYKKTKLQKRIMTAGLSLAAIFCIAGLYNPLSVRVITVSSDAIDLPVRIALISDLHSCRYGSNQTKLIEAVDSQNPDIICLVGDIFDDRLHNDNSEIFLSQISGKYPCFYVTGNHEHRMTGPDFSSKMEFLDRCGVTRLINESRLISVNDQNINIAGIDDPRGQSYSDVSRILTTIRTEQSGNCFSLLLSHRPEYCSSYIEKGFDLTLCGHAHGGQWRIPFLLENGLLAPHQGLFPEYTNGKYTFGGSSVVVSRGLAKENILIPRFYNKPEIVIIELQ